MVSKIITGTKPILEECNLLRFISFWEREQFAEIKALEKRLNNIPDCAVFTCDTNREWGNLELRWTWFEVTL